MSPKHLIPMIYRFKLLVVCNLESKEKVILPFGLRTQICLSLPPNVPSQPFSEVDPFLQQYPSVPQNLHFPC